MSSPEREGKVTTAEVRSTFMQVINWCVSLMYKHMSAVRNENSVLKQQ